MTSSLASYGLVVYGSDGHVLPPDPAVSFVGGVDDDAHFTTEDIGDKLPVAQIESEESDPARIYTMVMDANEVNTGGAVAAEPGPDCPEDVRIETADIANTLQSP